MTEAEIKDLAERVLRPELEAFGLEEIVVHEDRDDPSDPVLFVDALLKPGSPPLGGEISANAHRALSRGLLQAGERRFPYFRVRHPDEEASERDMSPGVH